jgi:histidine triad (HIT) family protein
MFNHAPAGYVCPFCLIVAGREEPPAATRQADVVYRDELVTAFVASDWRPNNPGHVLVVPNQHYENVYDLPFDEGAQIQSVVREVALAMKRAYGCDGVSTVQHNEPAGYQDVWHYHVHVFPRYVDDDIYRSPKQRTTADERAPYAAKLRDALLNADARQKPGL